MCPVPRCSWAARPAATIPAPIPALIPASSRQCVHLPENSQRGELCASTTKCISTALMVTCPSVTSGCLCPWMGLARRQESFSRQQKASQLGQPLRDLAVPTSGRGEISPKISPGSEEHISHLSTVPCSALSTAAATAP